MRRLRQGGGFVSIMFSALVAVTALADTPASKSPPAPSAPATSTGEQTTKFGSWTISSGTPGPSQPAHYIAFVKSTTGDLFGFGCDKAGQSGVYAVFLSARYLAGGSNPTRDLEYVIDRAQVRAAKWDYLENYAYLRDPEAAREIASEIAVGHTLDTRAYTYELFAVDDHFDITGGKAAIETLFKDCRGG